MHLARHAYITRSMNGRQLASMDGQKRSDNLGTIIRRIRKYSAYIFTNTNRKPEKLLEAFKKSKQKHKQQ